MNLRERFRLGTAAMRRQSAEVERNAVVLLVDDDPAVLEALNHVLRDRYYTRIATRGDQALTLANAEPLPDLILLDVELPDGNGYHLCRQLKGSPATAAIPIIFLSSHSAVGDITCGLTLGAVDYVSKPVAPPILLARVQAQLRLREAHELLADQNKHLEKLVKERTCDLEARSEELSLSQDLAIMALGSIAETRDNETGNHIRRTRSYVQLMCESLAEHPRLGGQLDAADWMLIWKSAPLHDIGKVGIPDHILLKPGHLETAEFEIMKRHTVLGRDALMAAEERANARHSFLRTAATIAYSHHERWDGTGYPEGIGGDAIPMPARLMAVADVYDALISRRVYKEAYSHETAVEMLRAESGSHFDPDVIECFLELADDFREIAVCFGDGDTETIDRGMT